MQVIEGEKPYRLRPLNAGDERKVGAMVAKVTGDPRIQNAVASGEQGVIILAVISSLLDRASHEVALWCASLVGEDQSVPDIKEYRAEEREKAQAENRRPAPEGELVYRRELDIIERMDAYPSGTYMDIISDVTEHPSFDGFLTSSSRLGTGMMKLSKRFQKPSKNGSRSKTKK
jgi:hypothetical protein